MGRLTTSERLPARHPEQRGDHADAEPGQQARDDAREPGVKQRCRAILKAEPGFREHQHSQPQQQRHDDPIQPAALHVEHMARRPPSADKAAAQQIQDDIQMRRKLIDGNRTCPEYQRRCDDNQTHRLVEDDRLQRRQAEYTDQHRQAEFRAAETDQPAQRTDQGASGETLSGALA